MESKLLQPFLQAGLLNIGDSDERLEHVIKAIADLRKKLTEDHSLLIPYTLVSLDPNISDNEKVLIDTEVIVTDHWKALRSKFTERPIPLIRAVILNALFDVGLEDAKLARIIYLTATNFYPYSKLGKEKEIVKQMLSELGNLAEKDAIEEWSLSTAQPELKLPVLKVSGLKFNEVKIDATNLTSKLKVASNNSPEGYQPYHHADQWSTHFANNASAGISALLTSTFKSFADGLSPTSIEGPINKFFGEFKMSLDQSLKASSNSIQSVERRSKLLWWKETLYSTSLGNSYRTVNKYLQTFITAIDLYHQLPAIVPVSVDYLLRDTFLILEKSADKKLTFNEILKAIELPENKLILVNYFSEPEHFSNRVSVSDYFALVIYDKTTIDTFKQFTGIDGSEQASLNDIAVMVLHDFMAEHLTS